MLFADTHSVSLLRLAAMASTWTSYISTISFASLLHTKKILALSKGFISLDLMSTPSPSNINMMARKLTHQAPPFRHATNPGPGALPITFLNRPLRTGPTGEPLKVVYSYGVEWVASDLKWADRWDVYTIGLSVDDLHYFAMLHAFCVASLVTCFVVDMIIRTSRQDIAGYIEIQTLEEAKTTTPDVGQDATLFRPPQFSPMLLSVLVGTGA